MSRSAKFSSPDFNGNMISSFNHKQKLGVIRAGGTTAITSGADAGSAITDIDDGEVVVFDMD